MTSRSGNGGWVFHLARALARLAKVTEDHWHEIDAHRRERERTKRMPRESVWDPSADLDSFYWWSCRTDSKYFGKRYSSLRSAVHEVEHVIGQHPALEGIIGSADGDEFRVRLLNCSTHTSRRSMVAGLMTRAKQVGENGFQVASCELKELLDLSLDDAPNPVPRNLNEGCHVSAFFGLRFKVPFKITNDMTIVPLEQLDSFVNRSVLKRVMPELVEWKRWKSVGAIVRRFRWQPKLFSLDDKNWTEENWTQRPYTQVSTFVKDARKFVELLAVLHGVAVVYLMNIPFCSDRRTSLLLGQPYVHSSTGWSSWTRSFRPLRSTHPADIRAVTQATQIYRGRGRRREYAPVISRLAEALARSGQYAAEDKILDVAIALERMYKPNSPEVTYKLKTRAACFLELDTERRKHVFKKIGEFYAARSAIVHRRQSSAKKMKDAFETGFDLARRSLVKLLREDSLEDWNEVVLGRPKTAS